MTLWLTAGLIFTLSAIALILFKWGRVKCEGVTPVGLFTFIAILFTSGLDVGLIMFPLTEFGTYADVAANPEYGFTNPLAIEFGFWGFFIWSFYFLTCFYFCVIEPRVKFFEIFWVKVLNNIVIIGTCAFTAYLLLSNLPWYLPEIGDGKNVVGPFYLIVFTVISLAVYSSSDLRYVRYLSLASTGLFLALIGLMWYGAYIAQGSVGMFAENVALIGGYFTNLHQFVLPLNAYHEFYLFWWFAWSIMIGQFTSRFVGGLRAWQVLAAMLIIPSIPIALWFTVLYTFHVESLSTAGLYNMAMVIVGVTFVINSLDSLIRLYTDNLQLTVEKLGRSRYLVGNIIALSLLTLLFKLEFLQIEWVGALVIALMFACTGYILLRKYSAVAATGNRLASAD